MPRNLEIALIILVAAAGFADFRNRRIPNWLTLPGAVIGLALHTWNNGLQGALESLLGAVLGFGIFLALYIAGGMGAGDVKLFGAVGALAGPQSLVLVFVFTGLLGGIAAILLARWKGKMQQTLFNTVMLMRNAGRRGWRAFPEFSASAGPEALRLPYGMVIAAGTMAALLVIR